jgi:hypothetical protein
MDYNGLDSPGCDIPGFDNYNKKGRQGCFLKCCANHDKCFKDNGCNAVFSWPPTICSGGLAGSISKCVKCNNRVASCFANCYKGIEPETPNNAHYYCGKDNKYFDDPEDDPHMPPPLEPEPQRPDDPDGGLHDS